MPTDYKYIEDCHRWYRQRFEPWSKMRNSVSEEEFAAEAESLIALLWPKDAESKAVASSASIGGHGGKEKDDITGFARWFSSMQRKLNEEKRWSPTHEQAHRLLYRYAVRTLSMRLDPEPIHPIVEYYLRFLGKSVNSVDDQVDKFDDEWLTTRRAEYEAAKKVDAAARSAWRSKGAKWPPPPRAAFAALGGEHVPDVSQLGADNSGMWCGAAATFAFEGALREMRLRPKIKGGPQGAWAMAFGGSRTPMIELTGGKHPLMTPRQGDIFISIGFRTPASGHVSCAIISESFEEKLAGAKPDAPKPTVSVICVSGNSWGGGVNLSEAEFVRPPADYSFSYIFVGRAVEQKLKQSEARLKSVQDTPADAPQSTVPIEELERDDLAEQAKYNKVRPAKIKPNKGDPSWLVDLMHTSRLDPDILRGDYRDRDPEGFAKKLAEWKLDVWDPFAPQLRKAAGAK